MNTLQHFFTQFDALPEEQQNVQQFLTGELTRKCGISPEESWKIIQEISESLTRFESAHRDLMNCEKNGISEKRWLQEKLKKTSAETNVPLEKVGQAFTSLVNQQHQASLEELAGEKLNVVEEPAETDFRTQLTGNLETIHQTAFFQEGLVAQGVVNAEDSVDSPTMRKAVETDYFSPEERKAKEIAAAAIYADSRQKAEERKESYGSSWNVLLGILPNLAAIGGARCVSAVKAVCKIAEADGNKEKTEEAKLYATSGLGAAYEQAIKNFCIWVCAETGEGIGLLLNYIGIPVSPATTKWAGGMIGAFLASKIPYVKEFSKQMADLTQTVYEKAKSQKTITSRGLVNTARNAMGRMAQGVGKMTQTAKRMVAGWVGF